MNIKVPKFILDIFNKIFKKKKEEIAQIIVKVPTREELIENKETDKLVSVDNYKRGYENKLSQRLLFNDISSHNLQEDFKENQNIILNHIRNNNYNSVNEILDKGTPSELLEVKLEYLKLYMLNQDNSRLYNETLFRYMAISELKEQFFIRPSKRSAIKNEYDYLYSSLIIYASNNFATNMTGRLYLIRMSAIKNHLGELNVLEEELLNKRKNLVIRLSNRFIKDKLDNVLNSVINDMLLVAYLEIELEKYYNKNKNDYKLLFLELNKIKKQEFNRYNRDSLLKQIEELELKCLLYCKFGSNIPKELLINLYQTKFNVLTCDMDITDEYPISKDDYGYEIYKRKITKKVYDIINGKNINFNITFNNIDEAKSVFKKEFQDINKVMIDKYRLITLLSFDKEDGFNNIINRTIDKNDLNTVSLFWPKELLHVYKNIFLNASFVKWNNIIPLKSILEVLYNDDKIYDSSNAFIKMFKLYLKNNVSHDYCKLPDGVIKIAPSEYYTNEYERHFFPKPLEISGKIKFPSSIKSIDFGNNACKKWPFSYIIDELPYGVESIKFNTISDMPPIPSSVKKIEITHSQGKAGDHCPFLKFLDFKNSQFLHSKLNIMNLLNQIKITAEYTNIYIHLENDGQIRTIKAPVSYDDAAKKLIIKLASTLIEQKEISTNNTKDSATFLHLEIELEKYIVEHKEEFELDFLSKELIDISKMRCDKNNKQDLLKQIEKLESKILLKRRSCNIEEAMLNQLYEIKLKILTSDTYDLNSIDKDEYEYYEEIIKRKFSNIIFSIRDNFDARSIMDEIRYCLANYETERLERSFIYLFTNKYFYGCSYPDENMVWFNPYEHGYGADFRYLVPDDILKNKFKINVLLSLETVNDFIEMINNTVINKNDLETLLLIYPDEDYWKYSINSRNNSFDRAGNTQLKCLLEKIMEKRCSPYGHLWEYDPSQDEHNGFLFDLYRLLIFHRECWNNETKLNNVKNNQERVLTKK